jgi:hypothetical protein
MLLLLACGAGIYLGLNFSALVLLPFSFFGIVAFVVASWSSGQSLHGSAVVLLFLSLQAGYMLGLTARDAYGQLLTRLNLANSRRA